jgi:putative ABC transport system permease protein
VKMTYTMPGAVGDQKLLVKYYGEPPVPESATEAGPSGKAEPRYPIFDVLDRDGEQAGQEFFHAKDPVVMVSENFADHAGKRTGDYIELATPKGRQPFRIIAKVAEYANPMGTIYLPRATYLKFFNDRLISGLAVKLKRGHDPVQVRRELDRELSKQHQLTILLNSDIRDQVGAVIDNSFAYTRSIEIAALLVALLGLMNTLIITVMERTREIGLSRSVGMTRGHVSRMILIEAFSQGSLGSLVAIGIGVMLGGVWVTRSLGASLGWVVHFYVPWSALFSTFALGVAVTLLAAWYPARRAAAIEIVDALDYE